MIDVNNLENAIKGIDDAMERLSHMYPELSEKEKAKLQELTDRINLARADTKPAKPFPDGVHRVRLKTEKLENLRDILTIYKQVMLPALIRREASKLKSVKAILENQRQNDVK